MCYKYKNKQRMVFLWCETLNGKEHRCNYLNVFKDGIEDYYNHYNYCPYCGKKLKIKK